MLRQRCTKIVATVGPASNTIDKLQLLFERGVDVFRLNFSHGTHKDHKEVIQAIHSISKAYNRPIGILADLQGPKFRIGTFKNSPITLVAGNPFVFRLNACDGSSTEVTLPHPELFQVIQPGEELLVNDGKLAFRVDEVSDNTIKTTILVNGEISDRKGVNLPNTKISIPILTEKDLGDLEFILTQDISWIALSFIQSAEDVIQARKKIGDAFKIISKIEKPHAIKDLAKIVDESDGIMIARGDLGVELPPEHVPSIQRKILSMCKENNKPVIVATQMLESMITTPTPTRAEVSDVATAVYLGTDAVMLSAESASGHYPAEAVTIMDRILFCTEKDIASQKKEPNSSIPFFSLIKDQDLIVLISDSLEACSKITSLRQNKPVLVLTSKKQLATQFCLLFATHAVASEKIPELENFSALKKYVIKTAEGEGLITKKHTSIALLLADTQNSADLSHLHCFKN